MQSICRTNMTFQEITKDAKAIFLGMFLIVLSTWVRIPFYPVSFTMQTAAIFFLALTQSAKIACGSIWNYLLFASMGLAVFGFKSNPLWMLGNSAGYLWAFPMACYLISKLKDKSALFALICGQLTIYLFGCLWLIPLFGLKAAFFKGVIIFLPTDTLKIVMAYMIAKRWKKNVSCAHISSH